MDPLDREIQGSARNARRRQMSGRLATIASVVTFLLVGIGGGALIFQLLPEPGAHKGHVQRTHGVGSGEPAEVSIENDESGPGRGRSRIRGKVVPVAGLAFASAYFVFKSLKPED